MPCASNHVDTEAKLLSDNMTAMRVLLVNLAMESVKEVQRALSGQGYEITADRSLTVEEILTLSPEVLVTEVTPSDLSNCGLISQNRRVNSCRLRLSQARDREQASL